MYKFCPYCGLKNDNHKYCVTCGGYLIEEPDISKTNKNKKQIVNKQPLEDNKLDEIRDLLKQHKSLSEIKAKIKTWKRAGYKVEELEKMVEEYE